jgi:hypothetical protein
MTVRERFCWASLILALTFRVGCYSTSVAAQAQADGLPWEVNASDLQAVGFHLPSNMPTVSGLEVYQKGVSTHQELTIEWDPHTGYDHPVFREQISERSLKHEFKLKQRKTDVKGNATIGARMLYELGLEVVGVTSTGEVRGLANGPRLLIRPDLPPAPGSPPQDLHEYIKGKDEIWVSLPDDPKIEKLVLLLGHPNEKPRLEQVGIIDLTANSAPK